MRDDGAGTEARRFGLAAGMLSIGVGAAGLLTYVYFALASHSLPRTQYGEVVVLWSITIVTISTLYRPVEQLLSRTIAERQAQGQGIGQPLRVAATIQGGIAAACAITTLALHDPLTNLLSGDSTLYWILVAALTAYGASFFARGFLAGHRQFALFGALLLMESVSRMSFALVAVIGIASGQNIVALGIAVAPLVSLTVVPLAFARRARSARAIPAAAASPNTPGFTLAQGGGFAAAVLVIMLSEQTFMSAGVLLVRAAEGAAAAGFIFNVLMVARAPLLLFQAVATSLLPHLTRLRSSGDGSGDEAFRLSVRGTLIAIAIFAGLVTLGLLAIGPHAMQVAFGDKFTYDREGLVIVAVGMGLYLSAATLNQAAVAQGQVRRASACWAACAIAFIGWNLLPVLTEFRRVEVGFALAAALLCSVLYVLYRHPPARPADVVRPGSPEELEARVAAAEEA
jgi:O-antigen/teichoic acid export membrane protein